MGYRQWVVRQPKLDMQDLLDLIHCYCGGNLSGSAEGASCSECGRFYRFESGVLLMEPEDRPKTDAEALQRQEEATRDRQVGFYEVWMELHVPSRIERSMVRAALARLRPNTVIEVGCGPGRWTRFIAPRIERMVALDRSFQSLVRNRKRIAARGLEGKVLHVKGDATKLPARTGRFDAAFSGQLLEHLPTPELREAVISELSRSLAPGGGAFVSAYQWTPWNPLVRKKEGTHAGGMYYFRFDALELDDLLARHLSDVSVTSCIGHILLAKGTKS